MPPRTFGQKDFSRLESLKRDASGILDRQQQYNSNILNARAQMLAKQRQDQEEAGISGVVKNFVSDIGTETDPNVINKKIVGARASLLNYGQTGLKAAGELDRFVPAQRQERAFHYTNGTVREGNNDVEYSYAFDPTTNKLVSKTQIGSGPAKKDPAQQLVETMQAKNRVEAAKRVQVLKKQTSEIETKKAHNESLIGQKLQDGTIITPEDVRKENESLDQTLNPAYQELTDIEKEWGKDFVTNPNPSPIASTRPATTGAATKKISLKDARAQYGDRANDYTDEELTKFLQSNGYEVN